MNWLRLGIRYFKRQHGHPFFVCALLLLAAATELLGLASLLPVATSIFQPGAAHLGIASVLLETLGFSSPSPVAFLTLVVLAMIVRGVALVGAHRLASVASSELEAELTRTSLTAVMKARWRYISGLGSGKVLDAVTRLPSESGLAGPIFAQYLAGAVLAGVFICAVAYISMPTMIVSVILAVPLAMCMRITTRYTAHASAALAPINQQRNKIALELVSNAKYFKIGNSYGPVAARFKSAVLSVRLLNRRVLLAQALMTYIPDTIVAVGVALLIGVVYGFHFDGGTNFALALMLMYRAFHYGNQCMSAAQALARYLPSFYIIETFISAAEKEVDVPLSIESEMPFTKAMRFDRVSFAYVAGKPTLTNWIAEIKRGEIVLLKGESGAGKTTILDILTGLLTPDSGTVLVDDVPLGESNLGAWRRRLAYIPQEPPLFAGSVRSNLDVGENQFSDHELYAALKIAHLDDVVQKRSDGLDTEIGEGGYALSGGQRQRLLLARALLSNAEVIILDEPTSAVDPAKEALIFGQIFKELKGKKTLIMAVHRFELDPSIGRTIFVG